MKISNPRVLCLAVAIALCSAGLQAASTPSGDNEEMRKELREAQQQLAKIGQRVAELSAQVGGDPAQVQMFRYLGNPDRAVIGIVLGETDQSGVRIQGITPGGPADEAGLRAGDTITQIRGISVAGERPLQALRDALKDLKDGEQVPVRYLRDGKVLDAKLAAQRQGSFEMLAAPHARRFVFEMDGPPGMAPLPEGFDQDIETIVERAVGEAGETRINVMAMAGLGGLRLTSLNPGLGRYFGVNEGALVLEVSAKEYQGLQSGDVILEVDGKPVKDPRDAMRELTRQDPAHQVELKLQRDRVPQLVKVQVPEHSHALLAPPRPPRAPAPPMAPTPPAAPTPPPAPAPPPMPEGASI